MESFANDKNACSFVLGKKKMEICKNNFKEPMITEHNLLVSFQFPQYLKGHLTTVIHPFQNETHLFPERQ